jgi:hypothetical protein
MHKKIPHIDGGEVLITDQVVDEIRVWLGWVGQAPLEITL